MRKLIRTTKGQNAEAGVATMVVCQSDKRVTCDPNKPNALGHICQVQKSVKATAICKFDSDVWNLGGTCISNHVHALKTKICPPASLDIIKRIQALCQKPKMNAEDQNLCKPLAFTY